MLSFVHINRDSIPFIPHLRNERITMEYYLAIKKNEILPVVTAWIDLEGIILSEVSQTENDKYSIIPLKCEI